MEQDRRAFLKFFGRVAAGIGLTSLGGGFPLSKGEGAMTNADHGWSFWEEVYQILKDQYSIHVKCATEGDANAVRIAPHYYNTQDEFDRLGLALSDIAGIKVHDRSTFLKGLIGS